MNIFEDLIGGQLIELNNDGFVVVKEGKEYHFDFDTDGGDCCGYADIDANFLISDEELARNPIIVDIEESTNMKGRFSFGDDIVIKFFGEQKQIAQIECEAGSGSGWHYGAWASVTCRETKENRTLVEW